MFVSSHMMAEMEHTADRLIVIGQGRLIADESLEDFSAHNASLGVTVHTPDLAALEALLIAEGASVRRESDQSGQVTGLTAARIGDLAHRHRIVLHELATHTSSLESAFMSLTADSIEYLAGEAR
ncbi:hypothetical protein [Streptomyces sp. NPDC051000]|uniref:hypothetical protein n=1 Tax=Streptomyces sp. NPDC051000 TaxID=3155520 RepID=UPI00340781A5